MRTILSFGILISLSLAFNGAALGKDCPKKPENGTKSEGGVTWPQCGPGPWNLIPENGYQVVPYAGGTPKAADPYTPGGGVSWPPNKNGPPAPPSKGVEKPNVI